MVISSAPPAFRRLVPYMFLPVIVGIVTCALWWVLFSASALFLEILFFRGCSASLGCFLVMVLASATLRRLRLMGPVMTGASVGLVGLYIGLIMGLFVVFPVSYDRSVSIFLLSRIAASGNMGMSAEELERELINSYVIEHHAVKRRIKEQLATGTINQEDNARVILSQTGRRVLCLNPFLERVFGYHNPELVDACPMK